MINSMGDTATNVSGGGKFMRQAYPGTIAMERVQATTSWTAAEASSQMFELTTDFFTAASAVWQKWYQLAASGYYGHYLPIGTSVRWTAMKSTGWIRPDLAQAGTIRTSPAYKVTFTPRLYTDATNYIDHAQCVFLYVRFCGDGVTDTDRGEQCDDGNMTNGDGCSNTCIPEVAPVCTGLTVTPTSVTNGGSVTYTCAGTNTTSYSIVVTKPDGSTLTSFTSPTGTIIVPATPTGTYTAKCFVNGQTTTPTVCQKTFTNNTVVTPVCTGLSVTPTSVTNGGQVTYTCTGDNVSSYSVVFSRPDGSILQTLATSNGSVTIPATPVGTYTAKCFVNGQTTTPAICEKTIPNNTVVTPMCDYLSVSTSSVTNGGNVTYTCSGTNTSSYSVVFTNPNGSILQTLTTSTGLVTIPSSPVGTYTARCYVNGQSSTPTSCEKTINNNTVVENPACTNLSVWTSGTNISYSCTGSGPISGYTIERNGSFVSNSQSGSINAGYGNHTVRCYVNGNITSSACERTITISQQTNPAIQVIKDDNDNRDDRQDLQIGSSAIFSIVVRNTGSEPLDNVILDDPRSPECNRSSSDTRPYVQAIGNRDSVLDPGESFSYICQRNGVDNNTFPGNENRICVNGRGITSNGNVNSCDTTRIYFNQPADTCAFMDVQFDKMANPQSHVRVSCSPSGGYKLGVVSRGQIYDRRQSPIGQFDLDLDAGNYTLSCIRDGENRVQPSCTRDIKILLPEEPQETSSCKMTTSPRYGGAPLKSHISCESSTYSQCMITFTKDGKPWKTIYECDTYMTFKEAGNYHANCTLDDGDEDGCSANIAVDVMTEIHTGPWLPIIIIMATSLAAYVTYRRRKTA
jgi:cysteine-rich repeat protein